MRKLRRSIAKANMKDAGITKLFKKVPNGKGGKSPSIFARSWRFYVA